MGEFFWEPQWVEIIAQQERVLRYGQFTRKMALDLGLRIIQLAEEKYHESAAVRIVEDQTTIFSYKMPGTSLENDWWMDRKLAVTRYTGTSSLRAYVEAEAGLRDAFWQERPDNFAPCGGCFPILPADGSKPWAFVLVSGMPHQHDHQVIVDAISWQLGADVDSLE